MPGVFAVYDRAKGDAASTLGAMLNRATHHSWYVVERYIDPADLLALGRVSLGVTNADPQPVNSGDGSLVVAIDGELYDYAQLRSELERRGCRFSGGSHAEVLLHGYRQYGKDFFRRLNGKFTAVLWDSDKRRLIAVNDRFGMRPLYYSSMPGRLLVAAEIKAILQDPDVSRQPSLKGLSQFFTYGQYLGDDTGYAAIRLLPGAGWLEFDVDRDELSVGCYWQPETMPTAFRSEQDWLTAIDEAFVRAVQCRTDGTAGLGISLSGGLDARTILGVMDHSQVSVTSIVLGIEGSADHRAASQLAALVGCRHIDYVLGDDFLAEFAMHLRHMVHLTDGQYLSQCIIMPTLPLYRELGIDVLLRGHAGELMHMNKAYNFSLDRRGLSLQNETDLYGWVFDHLRAYMLDGVQGPLLATASRAEVDALARESLGECLSPSAGMAPLAQRIWHLFLTQRSRRETALSLVKFGSLMEIRLPYLDNDLVDLLLAAPPNLKLEETLQGYILAKRRPEFRNVFNVNTGARIGAGPWAKKTAGLKQKVLAKLRVKGHQPYERLGLWLRRELRPLVRDILLSERCLTRGILAPDTVRQVVGQHLEGKANHTFLLMALMIFEQGQRDLVDAESLAEHADTAAASVH